MRGNRSLRIAVGCDHNGVELKRQLMGLLQELGHEYLDFGCYDSNAVDYPDVAEAAAQAVGAGRCDQGMLICGTGIGMSIAANKVAGVRAALCHSAFSARRARAHNDANIICLGGQVIDEDTARETVRAYLDAEFEGGRHARRVGKINALEELTAQQPRGES